MEIKELNIDVKDFIKIDPPLNLQKNGTDSEKFNLLLDNEKIVEIFIKKDQLNILELDFFQSFRLITPNLERRNNKYAINYSLIPLTLDDIIDFRYIIIKINKYYLIINVNFDNDYSLIYNDLKKQRLIIKFSSYQNFNIRISVYNKLNDFYKLINKNISLLPIWIHGLGLVNDYKKKLNNDVKFADIKEQLETETIYLLLKNWEDQNSHLKNNKNYIENIQGYLQKLILNDIYSIFQFDNTVPIKDSIKFPVLRMRNGELATDTNRVSLDYFNKEGEKALSSLFNKILNMKSSGIYLYPGYAFFSDSMIYKKTICKSEIGLLPYSKNIQKALKIINKITSENKKESDLFLSNILSPFISSLTFLREFSGDIYQTINTIEEFYRQGYVNFGFYIKNESFNFMTTKNSSKEFILLLLSPLVFFDIGIIIGYIKKNNILKDHFVKMLKKRMAFRILFDNLVLDFKENGVLPIKAYSLKNEIVGFFMGKYLFCAFLKERIFDSIFTLPEGKWYSQTNNIIVEGKGNFIHRGEKDFYLIFQKEATIIQYIVNTSYNQPLNPNKIIFSIFPLQKINEKNKFIDQIVERMSVNNETIDIIHNFKLKFEKSKIIITYHSNNKNNLDRDITFHIVIEKARVKNIICNDKKILFSGEGNKSFVEFGVINKNNKINIEIL